MTKQIPRKFYEKVYILEKHFISEVMPKWEE